MKKAKTLPERILNYASVVNAWSPGIDWYRRKEIANSSSHRHVILVPDYTYETAKEQKKLSNALRNARRINLAPAYIKNGRIFVQGNFYSANNIPECSRQNDEAVPVAE